MNSIWESLLWKEWSESRWKLLSLTVILFAMPLYALWDEPNAFVDTAVMISIAYVFITPFYIAAGVCAGEASGRTLTFLQATPVARPKWALVKLLMGWFTILTPVVLLILLAFLVHNLSAQFGINQNRSLLRSNRQFLGSSNYFTFFAWAAMISLSMFLWSLALGVNRGRELWAIAFSLGGYIAVWFVVLLVLNFVNKNQPFDGMFAQALIGFLPGGLYMSNSESVLVFPRFLPLLCAFVSHGGMLCWFLTRFGQSTRQSTHSPKGILARTNQSTSFSRPLGSTRSAILWMQVQEIAPLAVACVAVILLPTLLIASMREPFRGDTYTERISEMLPGVTAIIGFFFAILVGVGVFLRDLEPGLNTFWRSRPISANEWFWTKYLSALIMLGLALCIPAMIIVILNPNQFDFRHQVSFRPQVIAGIFILVSTYSVAAATTAIVRHAIYGSLLSLGFVVFTNWVTLSLLHQSDRSDAWCTNILIIIQTAIIGATIWIAWLAVTRDWGWKR